MSDAKRFNSGKIELTLLDPSALEAEALVWMMGAEKYGVDNWRKLWGEKTIKVVMDSAMRHMLEIVKGNPYDNESQLYHAAHVRCNMAMLIYYYNHILELPLKQSERPSDDNKE